MPGKAVTHRVFVYGSLKRGQRNYHYLRDAQFIGEFITDASYSMYCFTTYPAVCLQGEDAIQGEVYDVTEAEFHRLDELECYPEYYQRIEIRTTFGAAWMYFVEPALCQGRPKIGGCWPAESRY